MSSPFHDKFLKLNKEVPSKVLRKNQLNPENSSCLYFDFVEPKSPVWPYENSVFSATSSRFRYAPPLELSRTDGANGKLLHFHLLPTVKNAGAKDYDVETILETLDSFFGDPWKTPVTKEKNSSNQISYRRVGTALSERIEERVV